MKRGKECRPSGAICMQVEGARVAVGAWPSTSAAEGEEVEAEEEEKEEEGEKEEAEKGN